MVSLRFKRYIALVLLTLSIAGHQAVAAPTQPAASDPHTVINQAQKNYEKNTIALASSTNPKCTSKNIVIRRAWDDLSSHQRLAYINAVKCVMSKPAQTPKYLAPGARTLYDDFVYAHINQTNFIHLSGLFLPWHRQYICAFEQTLRTTCGYTGYLPYWPWERHSANQSLSPVFASTPASFGGNGVFVPLPPTNGSTVGQDPPFTVFRPAGTGGGCIIDGAFASTQVNLGPVDPVTNPPSNLYGTAYNPRCRTRDFLPDLSVQNLTYAAIAGLYQLPSIHAFNPLLQIGVHALSHTFIGGDANDFYTSPNDPVFFLLHAQIDRLWSIWQAQDYGTRALALDGTVTLANVPPSENATVSTVMKMGLPAGGDIPIGDVMLTVQKGYCYMYL